MKSLLLACLAALTLVHGAASAQVAYPDHPVRIIVPFPPGGPADALARIIGDKLAQSLGKPFVVDNKAGAGGNIGTRNSPQEFAAMQRAEAARWMRLAKEADIHAD